MRASGDILWRVALESLPGGPMVRDVSYARIATYAAERLSGDDAHSRVAEMNISLKRVADVSGVEPVRLSIGQLPNLDIGRSKFFQNWLSWAALNGPQTLIATLRVIRAESYGEECEMELSQIEKSIRSLI